MNIRRGISKLNARNLFCNLLLLFSMLSRYEILHKNNESNCWTKEKKLKKTAQNKTKNCLELQKHEKLNVIWSEFMKTKCKMDYCHLLSSLFIFKSQQKKKIFFLWTFFAKNDLKRFRLVFLNGNQQWYLKEQI